MKEDNELLDSALDSAEAKMMEAQEPSHNDALAEDVAIHEATKPSRERDERGKFAKRSEAAATEEQEENSGQEADAGKVEAQEQEIAQGPSQDEAPIELPAFWPAELREAVAKGTKEEVVKHFASLDQQRNEWANRVANESERGRAIEKRVGEVFEPYRLKLQANGVRDPLEATERLLAWNEIFEQDPRGGIADLMRKNGLTPHDFFEGAVPQDQSQNYADPRVQELESRLEAFEKAQQEEREKASTQQFQSHIDTWKSGKDSQGQERKAFAEMYAPQIDHRFNQVQAANPQASFEACLNHAYELVKNDIHKLHGITPQSSKPAKSNEQVIAEAKKAQALAGASASGGPVTGQAIQRPRLKGKNFEEKLDSALDNSEQQIGH